LGLVHGEFQLTAGGHEAGSGPGAGAAFVEDLERVGGLGKEGVAGLLLEGIGVPGDGGGHRGQRRDGVRDLVQRAVRNNRNRVPKRQHIRIVPSKRQRKVGSYLVV